MLVRFFRTVCVTQTKRSEKPPEASFSCEKVLRRRDSRGWVPVGRYLLEGLAQAPV